ncbi:hypothetical protein NKG05_09330 [Oerskovia sp. M15]
MIGGDRRFLARVRRRGGRGLRGEQHPGHAPARRRPHALVTFAARTSAPRTASSSPRATTRPSGTA